jgi:hypothetical protein
MFQNKRLSGSTAAKNTANSSNRLLSRLALSNDGDGGPSSTPNGGGGRVALLSKTALVSLLVFAAFVVFPGSNYLRLLEK